MAPIPPAEVHVDERLVAALLRAQHPDLAPLPIHGRRSGWDNVTYRLGDDLAIRLPRRRATVDLLIKEQTWLPSLARRLPVAIPAPLRTGAPGAGFPWPWSVVPWIPGATADLEPLDGGEAARFAGFLTALHAPAPPDAPTNPYRGMSLGDRAGDTETRLRRLREHTHLVEPRVSRAWQRALAAPPAPERRWRHGDLHPSNLVSRGGVLVGVLDWGDLAAGDAATDLAAVWMLFEDPAARAECLSAYGATESLVVRGMGWAIFFAAAFAGSSRVAKPPESLADERLDRVAAVTLRRLAQDL